MQMAEYGELVGAEPPVRALLPQTPAEPDDGATETGGFVEVIHGGDRTRLLTTLSAD
ncbi:hypothetical protein GCM10010339_87800 [Streptomyces alanosinicus]|uniref:Uncharacterized protein n=1 Tax=Streptomyces alanosinicus TaxID=68171 RepID=A0A918YSF1_9ACTN|nr:hypothetical protein GCM10010339_87800 [Streptomyces alanosinicus]